MITMMPPSKAELVAKIMALIATGDISLDNKNFEALSKNDVAQLQEEYEEVADLPQREGGFLSWLTPNQAWWCVFIVSTAFWAGVVSYIVYWK